MTPASPRLTRRVVVGAVATLALPSVALAQTPPTNPPLVGPLAPDPVAFKKALSTFTGSATPQAEGLQLDIPVLDNDVAAAAGAHVHDWQGKPLDYTPRESFLNPGFRVSIY